jgi:hypothetical protein
LHVRPQKTEVRSNVTFEALDAVKDIVEDIVEAHGPDRVPDGRLRDHSSLGEKGTHLQLDG